MNTAVRIVVGSVLCLVLITGCSLFQQRHEPGPDPRVRVVINANQMGPSVSGNAEFALSCSFQKNGKKTAAFNNAVVVVAGVTLERIEDGYFMAGSVIVSADSISWSVGHPSLGSFSGDVTIPPAAPDFTLDPVLAPGAPVTADTAFTMRWPADGEQTWTTAAFFYGDDSRDSFVSGTGIDTKDGIYSFTSAAPYVDASLMAINTEWFEGFAGYSRIIVSGLPSKASNRTK